MEISLKKSSKLGILETCKEPGLAAKSAEEAIRTTKRHRDFLWKSAPRRGPLPVMLSACTSPRRRAETVMARWCLDVRNPSDNGEKLAMLKVCHREQKSVSPSRWCLTSFQRITSSTSAFSVMAAKRVAVTIPESSMNRWLDWPFNRVIEWLSVLRWLLLKRVEAVHRKFERRNFSPCGIEKD